MLLNAINPRTGGVLIHDERGTATPRPRLRGSLENFWEEAPGKRSSPTRGKSSRRRARMRGVRLGLEGESRTALRCSRKLAPLSAFMELYRILLVRMG